MNTAPIDMTRVEMEKAEYATPELVFLGTAVGATLNSGGSCTDGVHFNKGLPPGQGECNQTGFPGNS